MQVAYMLRNSFIKYTVNNKNQKSQQNKEFKKSVSISISNTRNIK